MRTTVSSSDAGRGTLGEFQTRRFAAIAVPSFAPEQSVQDLLGPTGEDILGAGRSTGAAGVETLGMISTSVSAVVRSKSTCTPRATRDVC